MQVELEIQVASIAIGWVVAEECREAASGEWLDAALAEIDPRVHDARQAAVRDLLRHGEYRPTGRGKPAWEYLVRARAEGAFPRINALVDAANLVSLAEALPVSVIDLDRAAATAFAIRRGRAEERYVFNATGQVIELTDLLLVARLPEDSPCATPVKDSHATKTTPTTTRAFAVVYAPIELAAAAGNAAARMAALFAKHACTRAAWGVETARHPA